VIYESESYAIRGAVYDVYRVLGPGFLESVYQECLQKEFICNQIPYRAQPELKLFYKGTLLEQVYRPDFICFDKIIVELKALSDIRPEHHAQVLNYLKATEMKLGLLVNFGCYPKATVNRLVL